MPPTYRRKNRRSSNSSSSMSLLNSPRVFLYAQLLITTTIIITTTTEAALAVMPGVQTATTTKTLWSTAATGNGELLEKTLPMVDGATGATISEREGIKGAENDEFFSLAHTAPSTTLKSTGAAAPSDADVLHGEVGADDCHSSLSSSLLCRGARVLRNVVRNLSKTDKPIVLFRGLEIVPIPTTTAEQQMHEHLMANVVGVNEPTILGSFAEYLRTHELNVKFSDLLSDVETARNGIEEARKKDKGQGLILAMAMMSAKMMAMLGLGGIGALAMKALGVAMMALMMAALVGVKSLAQHGGESSHSVSYVTASEGHHHRRRRRRSIAADEQDLAYSGWPYGTAYAAADL